jgi:hypothetical protein
MDSIVDRLSAYLERSDRLRKVRGRIRGVKCTFDDGGNWEPHNMTVGAQRKLADRREFRSRAGV